VSSGTEWVGLAPGPPVPAGAILAAGDLQAPGSVSASSCASKCYYNLHLLDIFRLDCLRNGSRKRQGGSIIGNGCVSSILGSKGPKFTQIWLTPGFAMSRRQARGSAMSRKDHGCLHGACPLGDVYKRRVDMRQPGSGREHTNCHGRRLLSTSICTDLELF
jgi:hypothetical protein